MVGGRCNFNLLRAQLKQIPVLYEIKLDIIILDVQRHSGLQPNLIVLIHRLCSEFPAHSFGVHISEYFMEL